MTKKRITVDSVVNPLEGSAFFIAPPPDNKESDKFLETSQALVIQESEEKLDRKIEIVKASANRKVSKKTNALKSSSLKPVDKDSVRTSLPRRKVGRPKKKRYTKRQSFELFTDQMFGLRSLQAQYELEQGRKVKLSDLVREALDTYLKEKGYSNPIFRPEE